MALDKVLIIYDEQGNPVDYDILAKDVKFQPDGKDLPTKLAEMQEDIDDAASSGYAPPEGGIPATDLAQSVQDTLNDVANKVDKVTGKGLSTEDFTAALKAKLEALDPYTKAQVNAAIQQAVAQIPQVNLDNYYNKQQVDNRISQMQAQIEEENLTVITGDRLSLWLDEDGESINIMAGEIPDIAAAPTISHVINNDGTATVTITNNEQGATIHYTTNGDTPTESSSVYSSALTINTAGPHTIKAITVVQDKMNSSVATDTFSVVSCQTPVIAVDNSARNTATVTATAGAGESVTLTVGGQTATGTGSASVTINKTDSTQTLSATATATATGKLTATATQNVTIGEKVAYVFGAHSLGGKAVAGTTQGDIQITLNNSFANQAATITEEDGVIWWELDCANQVYLGTTLQNEVDRSSSIFSAGAAKILTIEHIPDECTIIKNADVFAGCTALEQFKVGSSHLTELWGALQGNTSLEVVVLPSSTTYLNDSFKNCTALESVTATGVTQLVNGAFNGCTALATCILGQLTSISNYAFRNCSSLDFDDVDFGHAETIGDQAFTGCTSLTSAVLVNTRLINSGAFKNSGLTSLTLPVGLDEVQGATIQIKATAFNGCPIISEIIIPACVTEIGYGAFQSSTMKTFHVRKVISSASEAASVAQYGLNHPTNKPTIYVPVGTAALYKEAWTQYDNTTGDPMIQEEPTNS